MNDRVYKVFRIASSEAPERCVANAFLMFCEVVKRLQLLLKSLMLFDTFWSHFAKRAPKVSINDRFYKVFRVAFSEAPKRCVANAFLMFCEVVKRLQLLLKNLLLFDTFWSHYAKRAPKISITTGFIRYFE